MTGPKMGGRSIVPRGGSRDVKFLSGPPTANSSTHLAAPFQDDDRNDSLCLLRVVAESRENIAMRLVETIALDSLRNRRCAHLELLRAHLNLSLAILHQIMVPAGMRRRAALRRRDNVTFTITVVDERRRAQLAAFGPARREEQEVVAPRLDAFSALRVELVNNASVPIRHALTNALEDCAIPLPVAERRARCPRCLAPWRDTDRVRSQAFVNSPAESIEHDPGGLK